MGTINWRPYFKKNIIHSAEDYISSDSVLDFKYTEDRITAVVNGIEDFPVDIHISDGEITEMKCACPYAKAGSCCKHMAAVFLTWESRRKSGENLIFDGIHDKEIIGTVPWEDEKETEGVDVSPENINEDVIAPQSLSVPEGPTEMSEEKKKELISVAQNSLQLFCEIDDVITYAAIHNGAGFVRDICLTNTSEEELAQLKIKIIFDNDLAENYEISLDNLKPGEEKHFKDFKLSVNAGYLASLTERSSSRMTASVYYEDILLTSKTMDVAVLAFDEWPGLQYTPELLAAFAMPNHPAVTSLLQLSAKYLEKWTGDPSLAGYQFNDPNRVKNMAAAAYAAIQQKNITYAEPPSSFEKFGQRIRLADAVLDQHMGTCMDLTLLYAACMEAMGLNPVLVMMKGHIFAGVWLLDQSFSDMITEDPSQLEKRMSRGIREMLVVECTAMCAGRNLSFDEAAAAGESSVSDYNNFAFAIDVKRARSMGIRPLPVRIRTAGGFEVQHEDRRESDVTSAPKAYDLTYEIPDQFAKEKATKLTQWERKLLDLSLRNMLINMRMTKAVVPLLASDISILEDALSEGEEFLVLPRPMEMSYSGGSGIQVEALSQLGSFADFIAMESKHRRLHSLYTEKELNSSLTKIYRAARSSMEENGVSTLYLALGLLRWFEGKSSGAARYAPIILIPIDIIRKSASKGYAMRMRDEDAQMNITLLEFLKQSYGIQIAGLNPLPADEHGADLPRIFALIRRAVMELPMWDVAETGFIGNFSFSQFVMWNDIHGNSAFLEKNKIVRSLMHGAVEWDCIIPENVDSDEAYLPVTVDASQLKAINMAAAGVSFVLHGPPGTGKSQTITAMIANALTRGKTVLFVAEKMAALEVVQKRLTLLGIQDFCLELHSNKATKKAVLDQLRRGLEIGVWGLETDYAKKIQDVRSMRRDLDAYAEALHKKRPFGKSLRQLMDLYETFPQTDRRIRFDHAWAGTLTEGDLEHQIHSLEKLVAAGKAIGHPKDHPLSAVRQPEYSQRMKFELEDKVHFYIETLEQLRQETQKFTAQIGWDMPDTQDDWTGICDFAKNILAMQTIPEFLRHSSDLESDFRIPCTYLEGKNVFDKKYQGFLKSWDGNFLRMDMGDFRRKYDQANKKFFGKNRALSALTAELQAYASFTVETHRIPAYLTDVEFLQQEQKKVQEAGAALSEDWKRLIEKYPSLENLREYQKEVTGQIQAQDQYRQEMEKLDAAGEIKSCMSDAESLLEIYQKVKEAEASVNDLLTLDFGEKKEGWLDRRIKLCTGILENASSVKDWIVYRRFAADCREMGLGAICDAYEAGMASEEVIPVYLRSIYRTIILSVIENEPVLNAFTGASFNEKIEQFKKLDQEFMQLTKDEMYYKLTHNLPTSFDSVEVSRELNILRRAISSNGRGLSIRSLFEQIPHILPRLCPCMLMSPISVAQYLKPENDLADIVIFDEASQLPTCKAVGVLARGKDAVIVGDPNQMPPTSFFAGSTIDEDNLDIEDLDSILDDCLALGMPSAHLQWHYRSRHESLIAFSNREFYENSMLTFPSVNDLERRVSLVKTEGFFDRGKGRVNEGEAHAIVAEIRRRYEDPRLNHHTLGVVTFNISQQALIEDLLQEEYQKDPAFDAWANTGEEPMFVKNLENVQGDERDVILFSIAFGPDAEGKLSLNFGPLNKNGGWKRLNVAVSRARSEMKAFTTMTADRINLKRTRSKGVEALRDFLEFAEKGRLQGETVQARTQKDAGILEHICKAVSDAGYTCQTGVGHSKFKVDIAVINPYFPEEYLLGILLDGKSYRRSGNTKDREVAQINVLNSLGWQLHRIWTMDWWDNREKELGKLLNLLDTKKEAARQCWLQKQEEAAKPALTAEESDAAEAEQPNLTADIEKPEAAKKEKTGAAKTEQEAVSVKNSEQMQETVEMQSKPVTDDAESECDTDIRAGSPDIVSKTESKKIASGIAPGNPDAITVAELTGQTQQEKPEDAKESTDGINTESTEVSIDQADTGIMEYQLEEYRTADIEITDISTSEYVKKENLLMIAEKMQQILEAEAPITYERLVKKALRGFHIARSSSQTLEATDKAFKKAGAKISRQAGVRFCWRKDQVPEEFRSYRTDAGMDDRRGLDEICQQELKNAVCIVLSENGAMGKEELTKAVIRLLGYSRSSAALAAAIERGLKYGRKTGEIVQDAEKRYLLNR